MEAQNNNGSPLIVPKKDQSYEVTLGSDVTVLCDLPSEINTADMEIRWFKGTDCVCLYMEEQVIVGVDYKGRANLKIEDISLELQDFRESDDGDYLCQVTRGSKTENVRAVKLSLKTNKSTEMLPSENKIPPEKIDEKIDEKKMERSVLMAVITELKETKQECKKKDAEIKELKSQLPQTVGEPDTNTQEENMHRPAQELHNSELNRDNPETKTTPLGKLQNIEEVKVSTYCSANELHQAHKTFIDTLRKQMENLREVNTLPESDITLIFCPVSQTETEIKRFEGIPGFKLAVLVVFHPMTDPEKPVPDSSQHVKRTDIFTVDCLFNEDTGFLECQQNSDAVDKVANWLRQQSERKWTSEQRIKMSDSALAVSSSLNENDQRKEYLQDTNDTAMETGFKEKQDQIEKENTQQKHLSRPMKTSTCKAEKQENKQDVKVCVCRTGKTNISDFTDILQSRIENLTEVAVVSQSDIILVLCPIVSRAGTDIDNALEIFTHKTETQLAVLVVIHHTFEPEKVVPDSSKYVNRTDILTVDCLFYEDTGFLECQKNSDAADRVVNWLIQQGGQTGVKIRPRQNPGNIQDEGSERSNSEKNEWQFNPSSNAKRLKTEIDKPWRNPLKSHFEKVKVFSIVIGKINCHREFFTTLRNRIGNLEEGRTVEESNIILVFCPIISGAGTDIKAALNEIVHSTDSKLTVLVGLHPTFQPEKVVPDSSRCVHRTDILTVDCLFWEDEGLLKCQKNTNAADTTVNWLIQQGGQKGVKLRPCKNTTSAGNIQHQESKGSFKSNKFADTLGSFKRRIIRNEPISAPVHFPEKVKVFFIVIGKINCHRQFFTTLRNRIGNLEEGRTVEESNIILVFCPIISRAGTDIEAALNKIVHSTDSKPTVLVVLHPTFHPEKVVPDSSRCVHRTDILTVDCLFWEDTGLLECPKNSDAVNKTVNWLRQQGAKKGITLSLCQNKSYSLPSTFTSTAQAGGLTKQKSNVRKMICSSSRPVDCFVHVTEGTHKCDVDFMDALHKQVSLRKVQSKQESEIILLFCSVNSQLDIHSTLQEYKRPDKPAVVIFLHETLDLDSVPDSRGSVKMQDVLVVDCVFFAGEGLLECEKNREAISAVADWIKKN